jgi:hypothetical protein
MSRFSVQLLLADRTLSRWISPREAERLLERGDAVRERRKAHQPHPTIRLKPEVMSSNSAESNCSLTFADTETLAGAREASRSRLTTLRAKQLLFAPVQLPVVYI